MSVDAVTGKIIQNRVNDKINYQTSIIVRWTSIARKM